MRGWFPGAALPAMVATAGALATAAALAQPAAGVADPVAERQALMRSQRDAVQAINEVVRGGGDPASVTVQTGVLVGTSERIPSLFPPGSDRPNDRARPEIWNEKPNFERLAGNLNEQARRLAAATQAGDRATFGEAFRATTAACGACHDRYRLPEQR